MTEESPTPSERCLAGIEAELHEAEKAFADANARYIEAERDRRTAIEIISRRQVEIDATIALLRERSIPGTRWNDGSADIPSVKPPLDLSTEAVLEPAHSATINDDDPLTSRRTRKALEDEFGKLRESRSASDDDPVLKVISGRRK